MKVIKTCPVCGEDFTPPTMVKQEHCSKACWDLVAKEKRKVINLEGVSKKSTIDRYTREAQSRGLELKKTYVMKGENNSGK